MQLVMLFQLLHWHTLLQLKESSVLRKLLVTIQNRWIIEISQDARIVHLKLHLLE